MYWTRLDSQRNSVTQRRIALRLAIALSAFVVVCGCRSNQPPNVAPVPAEQQPAPVPTPKPTPPPAESVAPAQIQIESVAIQLNQQVHTPELAMTVRNTGSSWAETSGGCEWKCPVTIKQITGFLSAEDGDIVKPGQVRVLSPGGGVVNICDGNKLPLQLSCNLSVQTLDAHMQKVGGAQTLHYSQTVTPP